MTEQSGHELGLQKTSVKKIIKESSDMRVSGDATRQVMAEGEEYIRKLANAAGLVAKRADRKTIMEEDIRVARRIMEGEL